MHLHPKYDMITVCMAIKHGKKKKRQRDAISISRLTCANRSKEQTDQVVSVPWFKSQLGHYVH